MMYRLFRLQLAPLNHGLNEGVVVSQPIQVLSTEKVTPAVTDMGQEQQRTKAVGQRDGSAHARAVGMLCCLAAYLGIGLLQRGLELFQYVLLFSALEPEEPLERVEGEGFNGLHRQSIACSPAW